MLFRSWSCCARAAASRSGQGRANMQRSMDVDAKGIRQKEGRDAGVRRPNAAAASDVPKVGWWPYSYDASFASVRIRCLRSEEHTSELQSLMRISYAVFCLKKKNFTHRTT